MAMTQTILYSHAHMCVCVCGMIRHSALPLLLLLLCDTQSKRSHSNVSQRNDGG